MSKELVPSHLLVPAGTGSLDAYIQEVNKIPVLTLEEEQDLSLIHISEPTRLVHSSRMPSSA